MAGPAGTTRSPSEPAAGTAAVVATANTGGANDTRRVVGRIDTWTGTVDYSTYINVFSANNVRSAVYNEGADNLTITGANSGLRTGALGAVSGATTQVGGAAPTNMRVVNQFGGANVISSASGAFQGLAAVVGSTTTILPGFPTAAGPSMYDFVFQTDRTVFVADDRTTVAGGLQRWTRTGGLNGDITTGAWSLVNTFNLAAAAGGGDLAGLRGLAGDFANNILFATTTDNRLVSFNGSFSVLATAPANTAWRGVEIVPTPGTFALLSLGGLLASRRRR